MLITFITELRNNHSQRFSPYQPLFFILYDSSGMNSSWSIFSSTDLGTHTKDQEWMDCQQINVNSSTSLTPAVVPTVPSLIAHHLRLPKWTLGGCLGIASAKTTRHAIVAGCSQMIDIPNLPQLHRLSDLVSLAVHAWRTSSDELYITNFIKADLYDKSDYDSYYDCRLILTRYLCLAIIPS